MLKFKVILPNNMFDMFRNTVIALPGPSYAFFCHTWAASLFCRRLYILSEIRINISRILGGTCCSVRALACLSSATYKLSAKLWRFSRQIFIFLCKMKKSANCTVNGRTLQMDGQTSHAPRPCQDFLLFLAAWISRRKPGIFSYNTWVMSR